MGFAHLVNTDATVEAFKSKYNIPRDVFIEHYQEWNIKDKRVQMVIFIPLMANLEGSVRFVLESLLLGALRFYGLGPDQCLPNFYRVIGCVSRLNRVYSLRLTHHDISFLYSCFGSLKNGYYLKIWDPQIRLISSSRTLIRIPKGNS